MAQKLCFSGYQVRLLWLSYTTRPVTGIHSHCRGDRTLSYSTKVLWVPREGNELISQAIELTTTAISVFPETGSTFHF